MIAISQLTSAIDLDNSEKRNSFLTRTYPWRLCRFVSAELEYLAPVPKAREALRESCTQACDTLPRKILY